MKIIDLLNKIANGENIKNIKYQNHIYEYYNGDFREEIDDAYDSNWLFANEIIDLSNLNDEIEILDNLEEEKKETKPLTRKDIEALGYACGEIQKCFTNGWTKSLENKTLEEEKKIPKKLPNKFHYTGEEEELANKINEIIDYLKSKGE